MIIKVTNQNFEKFKKGNELILLDFYADWCGHCKKFEPILEDVDKKIEEKIKIGKIDVDNEEELAEKFGVTSIPTMVFMKNGEIINRHIGAMNEEKLIDLIKQF